MNTLRDFQEKLIETAPEDIGYVYLRRVESKAGLFVYTYDKKVGKWKKYEISYEVGAKGNPHQFWENADEYYVGPVEEFDWAWSLASRYMEATVNWHGWGKEYLKEFQKWCGKGEEVGVWTLTTEQCVKRPAFIYHFMKDKIPLPAEEDTVSFLNLWEPDPRK